jgi:hypothetical protein
VRAELAALLATVELGAMALPVTTAAFDNYGAAWSAIGSPKYLGHQGMGVATFAVSALACLVLAILRTGERGRWRRSDERE